MIGIPLTFRIRYEGSVPGAGIGEREWKRVYKEAWAATGEARHKEIILEYHFRPQTHRRYPEAQKRTKRYLVRKKGHKRDLVFTGESLRRTERATSKVIGGRNTRHELRINAPALNFRPKGWDHTMRQELEAWIPSELEMLEKVHQDVIIHRLQTAGAKVQTKTIK